MAAAEWARSASWGDGGRDARVSATHDADDGVDPQGGWDLAGAAPDWLTCTTGHWMQTAGWLSADRPVCAILHLVESRSQFAHFSSLDTLKANRPYVMAAYGYWHAEAARHKPPGRGAPPELHSLRAVRLSKRLLRQTSSSLGALLNALQLLAAAAAVTGRTPVIPSVPCDSGWIKRHAFTPHGLADDYILQLPYATQASGERADNGGGGARCHLAIGGARCSLPTALPAWHPLGAAEQNAEGISATTIRLTLDGSDGSAAAAPDNATIAIGAADLRALRESIARQADAPMLEIDVAQVEHDGDGALSSGRARALRCGVPLEALNVETIGAPSARGCASCAPRARVLHKEARGAAPRLATSDAHLVTGGARLYCMLSLTNLA